MGCASSKLDDLPAVVLCRHRLQSLDLALHHRYLLSDSHLAYVHSLSAVGLSFRRFFDSVELVGPVLNLPVKGKATEPAGPGLEPGPGSESNSGSHLQFNSESDNDDDHHDHDHDHHHDHDHNHHDEVESGSGSDPDGILHHGENPGSPHQVIMYGLPDGHNPYPIGPGPAPGPGPYMHMNYMRKGVTPSVSYQQRPMSVETVQFGEPSQPFYSNPAGFNGYNNGYMSYGPGPGMGPGQVDGGWSAMASTSGSKPTPRSAPPPPPPAATSSWDFLNLFENMEGGYPSFTTASLDSREVREQEGIPDLEDEEFEHEVVKEVHGNQKLVDESHSSGSISSVSSVGGSKSDSKRVIEDEGVGTSDQNEGVVNKGRISSNEDNNPVEFEVHMVDKKVVGDEGKSDQQGKNGRKSVFTNVSEVVREIQVQFERASSSGSELDKVLEVGKMRYQSKKGAYQVSSKMLNVITPSLPSTSKYSEALLEPDEDIRLRSVNLAASLQKLCLWEKKLFEEVKAEEKMRVLHDRKIQKVKRMAERGAEAHKIESTRSVIRNLSTKIRIAIQIVDKISVNINKVRDEELWPQLKELMHGLCRMWKGMLECHHSQYQAIDGSRFLDALAFPENPTDPQLEATLQLEHDLINWTCRFTEWVGAQKGFIKALNSWLSKCLLDEPEITPDGVAPFSPGRAGAPPVFVICNLWNQSLERISETSEKEVIDSMRIFAMMVWRFRERDKGEMRQRMSANRDIERKVRNLEKEDSRIQKEIQALDNKILQSSEGSDGLSLSGHVVYQSDTSNKTSLHTGLLHVFQAMDRFTSDSAKVYEDLLERSEELVRDHGKVS